MTDAFAGIEDDEEVREREYKPDFLEAIGLSAYWATLAVVSAIDAVKSNIQEATDDFWRWKDSENANK